MLVLILFFCSGATALVYEVIWSRYLALMLGSTVQAQTLVLAVFMGGLALGNRTFGARSGAVLHPLRTYGIIELITGAYGLFFPGFFYLADAFFVSAGSVVVETAILPSLLKLVLSVLLLLGPTVLMGGTLPMLAEWIQRQKELDQRSRVGIFYAVNSLGAVAGAGLAGFVLVQTFGLSGTLRLTGSVNILVGAVAVLLARPGPSRLAESEEQTRGDRESFLGAPGGERANWYCVLVAVTGGISMGLEVLSARALVLMVGGSIQAFALVLMSFILGIGVGSAFISSIRSTQKGRNNSVYVLLLGAAAFVMIYVLMIERWALIYSHARIGLASNSEGYAWHQFGIGLMAFVIIGFPAAFLGAVVPLAIRSIEIPGIVLGETVGRLLTWNTLGAVGGVLLTGFVLMPFLGLRAAMATLGFALVLGAGFVAIQRQQRTLAVLATLFAAAAITGVSSTGEKWRHVMSAGLFRVRNARVTKSNMEERKSKLELIFYKDSADATVCVEKGIVTNGYHLTLRINGKSDASTLGDLATQYLLAHLPMMARPGATNVFLLGFGSGVTGGALLGHPIQSLTIAENCKPVLEAGALFEHWNRGVLTNSRARILNEDGRTVLKLRREKYDVIINGPSNPWVVGVGSIFSEDYYRLCASRLVDGGIMAQWFHQYEMSDEIVFMVLRTFGSVFPYMEIWDTQEGDVVLIGSTAPWPSDAAHYQALFDRPQPAKDLAEIGIMNPVALWARQIASQSTASAIAGEGPRQTDDTPLLEYAAPRAFFIGAQATHVYFFDERTVQFPLASRAKIAAMRSLPGRALLESFHLFGPSNSDIRSYLQTMAQSAGTRVNIGLVEEMYLHSADGAAKAAERRVLRMDPMGHIIFRKADTYPVDPPLIPPNARPEELACSRAELGLLRDEEHWEHYARIIEQVLAGMVAKNELRPAEFNPTYYAGLVVRFAIGMGDNETALRLLHMGLAFDPNDEQLSFLSRVRKAKSN